MVADDQQNSRIQESQTQHELRLGEAVCSPFDRFFDRKFILHEKKRLSAAFPGSDGLSQDLCMFVVLVDNDTVRFQLVNDGEFVVCVFESLLDRLEVILGDFEAVVFVVVVLLEGCEDVLAVEIVAEQVLVADVKDHDRFLVDIEVWHSQSDRMNDCCAFRALGIDCTFLISLVRNQ